MQWPADYQPTRPREAQPANQVTSYTYIAVYMRVDNNIVYVRMLRERWCTCYYGIRGTAALAAW